MRRAALLVGLIAIGACKHDAGRATVPENVLDGKPTADPATPMAGGDSEGLHPHTVPGSPDSLTPEAACERFEELSAQKCDWTARFPPEFHAGNTCVTSLNNWFDPATEGHDHYQAMIACWAQDCDSAAKCMADLTRKAPAPTPRTCGEDGTGAVLVDAKEYASRKGAAAIKFADVTTSEAAPIEVCGIQSEVEWMVRVKCNDGSNPYGSLETANNSRDSYVKQAGRCNSVLDRYTVKCPEATYPIYVDRYICPKT